MGFIPNALLIFKSHSKTSDYHDDMNKTNFMKWPQEKLIPNLPPYSLIVMNVAPYHTVKLNKAPTLSSTKADMQNWLTNKGLSYLPTMVKVQLYEIIKEHKETPKYEADQLLEAHSHKVAILPPYHCELNAIEFMWSLVKRRAAGKNIRQEANNVVKLTEEAFQSITIEDWQKQCEHVRHIEDKLSERDGWMDAEMDRFIIEVNDESDTESDSY
uniref:Tc1-like transposase DDE domain-containing protein n=1 Tax=Heliothis virescens TaxID=7102 RepID=A0A2A4J699_HELVI